MRRWGVECTGVMVSVERPIWFWEGRYVSEIFLVSRIFEWY